MSVLKFQNLADVTSDRYCNLCHESRIITKIYPSKGISIMMQIISYNNWHVLFLWSSFVEFRYQLSSGKSLLSWVMVTMFSCRGCCCRHCWYHKHFHFLFNNLLIIQHWNYKFCTLMHLFRSHASVHLHDNSYRIAYMKP